MHDLTDRHPSTQQVAEWFDYDHLADGLPRQISQRCHDLAADLLDALPDGPELTAGLRKLLEAKDSLVRQAVAASRAGGR